MALKGNLQDFSTTQLFNLINLARKTGTLSIDTRRSEADLSFREGKLLYAAMDGQSDRLVTVLAGAGKLTKQQAQAVAAQAGDRSDKEIGLLLINAGYVSQSDIVQSVRSHTLNSVYPLLTWSEGTFRFEPAILPISDRIVVPIDLESVIVEGSRRLKEWERLQEELPDLELALKFAERPSPNVRNISLTFDEWRVISFINPRNTIRQIAQHNGMGDFEIRKIVFGLLHAGLVEIVGPTSRAEPDEPAAATGVAPPETPVAMRRPDVKRNVVMRLIDRIRKL